MKVTIIPITMTHASYAYEIRFFIGVILYFINVFPVIIDNLKKDRIVKQ